MDIVSAVTTASHIANSQVVWSILCICLVVYVFWNSAKREQKLTENLEALTAAQGKQATAMQGISRSLTSLEGWLYGPHGKTYL
ncbi:BhlA/UviB family holin-like peptide [Lysinibacillus capsici]|uniref:BhlA/UviB family holin-like peptide n=1 Tax=Lysinibacillus capsici TaxID=2115968 RepID=UPI002152CD7C|nr:BhlA/UviB family holin-like peptide [Lysinibacillus capsici]MCR6522007.1 BhlA/UviB family holin-like peptide [Lysinibacillus capsici]